MSCVKGGCGQSSLLDAAKGGEDSVVKALLSADRHLDVNARDYEGRTPLSLAAEHGHASIVSQLLVHGASPNYQDFLQVVPLWYATRGGHADVVRVLLESGQLSDVNPVYGDRETKLGTPLSIALKKGYRDIVDLLAHVDSVDPFVQIELDNWMEGIASVIGLAVRTGYENTAATLFERVGRIGSSDSRYAVTVSELLVLAASVGSTRLVAALLAQPHMADPNTAFPHDDYKLQGSTPFLVAVKNGHEAVVRLLLGTKRISPDILKTAIFQTGKRDILKILLDDACVEPDQRDSEGRTPISRAAEHGFEEVIDELLLMGEKVDPNSRDHKGRTPLVWAIQPQYHHGFKKSWEVELRVVQQLLSSGRVDPNPADENGITPLYWAARNGAASIVKTILEYSNTDPNVDCGDAKTPLTLATSEGHVGVAEVLLRTGKVDINAMLTFGYSTYTALSLAAENKHCSETSVVALLLSEPGIDPNKKNGDGTTPLAIAARESNLILVCQLLAAGADPNAKDNEGRTPLHHAVIPYHVTYEGHAARVIQKFLALDGIDPDPVDLEGRTPFSLAAERGHGELVDIFMADDRINPDSMDSTGRSPLSWVIDPSERNSGYGTIHRRKEVLRRLLQAQTVNPNVEDAEGLTPLIRAIKAKHGSEFVELLAARSDLDIQRKARDGSTPFAVAKMLESTATISVLLERGGVHEISTSGIVDGNDSTKDQQNVTGTLEAEEAAQCIMDPQQTKDESDDDEVQDDQDVGNDSSILDDSCDDYTLGETEKHELQYQLSRSIRLPLRAQSEYTGLLESSEADLCPTCASIDLDKAFSDRNTLYQGHDIADLGRVDDSWKSRKCPMCQLIGAVQPVAQGQGDDDDCQYKLVAFSSTAILLCSDLLVSWSRFQEPWIDTMLLGVVRDSGRDDSAGRRRYGRVTSVLKSGLIGRMGSNCPYGTQAITVPHWLATPGKADLEKAKKWISYCCGRHSRRCNPRHKRSVPHFYLIDCATRLIFRHGEGDGSAAPTYAALSYVWGQPPLSCSGSGSVSNPATMQLEWIQRDKDGNKFLRPLVDGGVEPVVEDAIHVTLGLGYQYLWVDRYCIDQAGDATVKQQQLRSMHLIYGNAHVTLVMATGHTSSFGLAGATRGRPRTAMPCALVKGHALTCIPPEPCGQILSSAWAERGWTYQEGLFAHRRLFFTEHEMSFECRRLVCREAIGLPPRVLKLMRDRRRGPRLMRKSWIYDGHGVMAPTKGGFDLFELLADYTGRRLTYQSDALNAMLGILQAFSQHKRYPVYSLCGIPLLCSTQSRHSGPWNRLSNGWYAARGRDRVRVTDNSLSLAGFISGLCWDLRRSADRRQGFPSWSWTGWCGVVHGEPPSIVCGSDFDPEVSIVSKDMTITPWEDCYQRLVQAASRDGAPPVDSFSEQHYVLRIRAPVVTVRLYTQYDIYQKEEVWKGIVSIGDSAWSGYYHATRKDYMPSDLVREDDASGVQSWRQRLLEKSWLGIVLQHDTLKRKMNVLVVQEQHPPAANEYTYWERIGLVDFSDILLESSLLERRTFMLM